MSNDEGQLWFPSLPSSTSSQVTTAACIYIYIYTCFVCIYIYRWFQPRTFNGVLHTYEETMKDQAVSRQSGHWIRIAFCKVVLAMPITWIGFQASSLSQSYANKIRMHWLHSLRDWEFLVRRITFVSNDRVLGGDQSSRAAKGWFVVFCATPFSHGLILHSPLDCLCLGGLWGEPFHWRSPPLKQSGPTRKLSWRMWTAPWQRSRARSSPG